VAPVPLRLAKTEQAIRGKAIDSELLSLARKAVAVEIRPIDDIRSTARYRAAVAGNLAAEFLTRLSSGHIGTQPAQMVDVLAQWNRLPANEAMRLILPCCGSKAWARGMVARRPLGDEAALVAASNETWRRLSQSDWMEAFQSHPRIGGARSSEAPPAQSVEWSAQEQRKVAASEAAVKIALAEANREYERRFNRIFIECATGKSAPEILEIIRRRLNNDAETELCEAAEQQRQITEIRLRKWLRG